MSSTNNHLSEMAREMKRQLGKQPRGWLHQKLHRGLHVILERKDDTEWRLAIAREQVYPGPVEAAVVEQAFELPPGSEPAKKVSYYQDNSTRRRVKYFVLEWMWREVGAG